ncbi:MAG: DUF192 domain-containing protein [Nibricoccus sp.]
MKNANLHWRSVLFAATIVLLVPLTGCGKKLAAEKPEVHKTVSDYFPIKVGDRTVQMQLAVLPLEMQQGLMGRRDLGSDQGMIFVYQQPDRMSFYMRNTPTPLDIGFFDAKGQLCEVYPMHPYDEKTVSSRSHAIQFALEMNQGWYKASGVKTAAQLDLKALAAAMEARGFRAEMFGLPK